MTEAIAPFYPIVDSAAWIARLVPAGVAFAQLRMKDVAEPAIRRDVRQSLGLCARYGARLVINDYWRIALDEGGTWVHLGQEDLKGADLKALRAHGMKIGVSTHSEEELETALAIEADYVALGPIYPTKLKAMAWGPQGLERIGKWKRTIGARPLIAIGGITLERARACLEAGADSVSVVTDVVAHPEPIARARAFIEETRRAP